VFQTFQAPPDGARFLTELTLPLTLRQTATFGRPLRPTFHARLLVFEFDLDKRVIVGDALYSGAGQRVNFTTIGGQVLATFPVYLNRPLEDGGPRPSERCPPGQSTSTLPDICRLLRRKSYVAFLNGRSAGNVGSYDYVIEPVYRGDVYRGYSLPQASIGVDPVPDGFGVFALTKLVNPSSTSRFASAPYVDIRSDPWRIRPDLEFTMTFSSSPRCDPERGTFVHVAGPSSAIPHYHCIAPVLPSDRIHRPIGGRQPGGWRPPMRESASIRLPRVHVHFTGSGL
jgi:hypothetical protein